MNAVFKVNERIGGPEFSPQLLMCDELARSSQEDGQHLQRTALDPQTDSRPAQLSSLEI
jgi:hypothetical protein